MALTADDFTDVMKPGNTHEARSLRVCIVQPIVPHYRVPFFNRVAAQHGMDLEIWSDERPSQGSLKSAIEVGQFRSSDAPMRAVGPFLWQPGLVRAVRSGRFDVVVMSWNSRYVHLSPALMLARKRGVRTILWGHAISKHESRWRRAIRNRLLNHADAALVYNHDAAQRLIDDGIAREKVFVALNAIDQTFIREAIDHWNQRPDELHEFHNRHGITPGRLLVYISRLEPSKRIDILLDAFASVKQECSDVKLAVIGAGPDEPELKARVSNHRLNDSVIFAGALYDEMHIAPWCMSAACFPYPAQIGLSVLHAFGYGLPVITSDLLSSHGPEIEALRNGENGLLYRHGDTGDFVRHILSCLRDDELQQQLGSEALQTVSSKGGFTIETMVDGFMAAIEHVMKQ